MPRLTLTAPGLAQTPDWHLSVDGMSPRGPNLSHWPGNRTPPKWKADLSTGICLNYARASTAEQEEFLAGATHVLNDHYDTDGFLSLLSVLAPEVALPREKNLIAAAATGDFQAFQGEAAFAVDRIVLNLAAPHSPIAHEFAGLTQAAKDSRRYAWLLDRAEELLDRPETWTALYQAELDLVSAQLADRQVGCEIHPELGLAVVRSTNPLERLVVNTRAGSCYRVLHFQTTPAGTLYRYHDRTESWFEVHTFAPPPRLDLSTVRDELVAREAACDRGHSDTPSQWCLDEATEPVPELYHGLPSGQEYGQLTRQLTPSSLDPEEVEEVFAQFFARARVQH